MCEKVNGKCTGKSRLLWQKEQDVYTDECPALLLRRYGHLSNIWQRWKLFGNWEPGGSLDQPNLWIQIAEMCEIEFRKKENSGHT